MEQKTNILSSSIEYLKGVGPTKGEMLKKELSVFTVGDLLLQFPFRYIDKTKFHRIGALNRDSEYVQLRGILRRLSTLGDGRAKRLVGVFRDETGIIELIWFKGAYWIEQSLQVGCEYVVYGKINHFNGKLSIPHPEIEIVNDQNTILAPSFSPVYPSTEKLNAKGLDYKARRKLVQTIFEKISEPDIAETLPEYIVEKYQFPSRFDALKNIHLPQSQAVLNTSIKRLKFEELFFLQLRLLRNKVDRKRSIKGYVFPKLDNYFNRFFNEKLKFELTGAQKRVIREIRMDTRSGIQMNRLLQGDVGSGKTIVGLMVMLMALDNGYQACMLAPTAILAQQHFISITELLEGLDIVVGFLSGSVKGKKRKALFEALADGTIQILIGTHAILEDPVVFNNLGLAITDEQHRFGVAQRAKLWGKNKPIPPHVLVMTATPIPRTLSMTIYGDLDVSVIDELPPGRKSIKTLHKTENNRLRVFGMMKEEIAKGRQIYVVYPLIEESATLDLQNLEQGYEVLSREFPKPEFQISVVHGRMKAKDKDFEMQRFAEGVTQIMVATTVIEVGVNVPNASMMVIENTERFGLSQLHQLRGRVGRGGEQSFCILMSSFKLSQEAKERIGTMVRTNNGFEIAEADLKLRGPGKIEGTQQSGILDFKLVDLIKDAKILQAAREIAIGILEKDPDFIHPDHLNLRQYLKKNKNKFKQWSLIS